MKRSPAKYLSVAIAVLTVFIVLPALYGTLAFLVYSTPSQKALQKENRFLARMLPQMREKLDSLDVELSVLKGRDSAVFMAVFKSEVPAKSVVDGGAALTEEKVLRGELGSANLTRSERACRAASRVEDNWRIITELLESKRFVLPPLVSPLDGLTPGCVGASTGPRINPFYKVEFNHEGLDIVAPASTPVRATCRGFVSRVQRSPGGKGNMVEISHPGGFVTRYAHLRDVYVCENDYVDCGGVIGSVGDSGRAFSTHLHYEVGTDSTVFDPCQFLFVSIDPQEYLNILITSKSSGQSLD